MTKTSTFKFTLVIAAASFLALLPYGKSESSEASTSMASERGSAQHPICTGSTASAPDASIAPLSTEEDRLLRRATARFDDTLYRVAGTDELARRMADYYFQEAIFARIRPGGAALAPVSPGGTRHGGSLFIIIASREEFVEITGRAPDSDFCYIPHAGDGVIIMPSDIPSEPLGEIVLLHELYHAYVHRVLHQWNERENFGGVDLPVREEAVANAMGFRLMNAITDGAFGRELDRLARARPMLPNGLYYADVLPSEQEDLDRLFPDDHITELERGSRDADYMIGLDVAMGLARGQPENEVWVQALRATYIRTFGR